MVKNALMISTDRGLLNEKSEVAKRHAGYAHFADNLHILVFSLKKTHPELKIELAPNVFVYPTRSYFKPLFLWDAFVEGFFLCHKKKIKIIVTQNVFETGIVGYFLSKIFISRI